MMGEPVLPIKRIVVDIESYYSSSVNLKKMTVQQYVLHPSFECILICIKIDDKPVITYTGKELSAAQALLREHSPGAIVVAHNTMFDGAFLGWHLGICPAMWADTLSMARSLGLQAAVGGSLAALAKAMQRNGYPVPHKGTEVLKAENKRLQDFSQEQLSAYAAYCAKDVEITATLFDALRAHLPVAELVWQHQVLQMYINPQLRIDADIVETEHKRVVQRRAQALAKVHKDLGYNGDPLTILKVINSNQQFAEMIELYGGEVPHKISERTGKPTPALGITDEGFLALLTHPSDEIRALAEARAGLKSSIEESRCQQMAWLAQFPRVPVPYKISGAHTHRLGGGEEAEGAVTSHKEKRGVWNPQNLPSGRKVGQSNALRKAIKPPPGYVLVGADSSQIEVRCIDWMAGDTAAIEEHLKGVCPYSSLAAKLFREGEPQQIKRDAQAGIEPWATRRQISKPARLSLQFGSGAEGFRAYCKTNAGIDISLEDAELYKQGFRDAKPQLVKLWRTADTVLAELVRGNKGTFGGVDGTLFTYDGAREVLGAHLPGIQLPDGMYVSYPGLQSVTGKYNQPAFVYKERLGSTCTTKYIYGAKLIQNLTQAVAFACLKWFAIKLQELAPQWPLVLNSHDEHVLLVPKEEADAAAETLTKVMKQQPGWVKGVLPLNCEVHVGASYGELK